jgi:hypothetical protein
MCDSIEKSSSKSSSSVKEKKKRGRKPKNKELGSEEVKIPKKRGRKPKNILLNQSLKKATPKKRGRKPSGKILSLDNSEKKDSITIDDCIITHLPIKMSDIIPEKNKSIISEHIDDTISEIIDDEDDYDSSIDEYDTITNDDNVFIKETIDVKVKDMDKNSLIEYYTKKIKELENKNINKMIGKRVYETDVKFNYMDASVNKWKNETDIHCWWCCHNFESPPVSIPEKIYDKTYHVFGCFCSFNCAYSYNININDYKIWERLSMLKSLYTKMYNEKTDILPAPPRKALSMFGGHISIEEFRNNNIKFKKEYLYLIPPMVSIIPIIEESNTNTDNNTYVPINNIKNLKLSDKLKRNKPINNSKYSLVKTMGLKKKSKKGEKKDKSDFFI